MRQLDTEQIYQQLKELNQWQYIDQAINKQAHLYKQFMFNDFSQAFEFMQAVAEVADQLDHHPDWSNSFRQVTIQLRTHELQGISELDIQLASAIDNIYERYQA